MLASLAWSSGDAQHALLCRPLVITIPQNEEAKTKGKNKAGVALHAVGVNRRRRAFDTCYLGEIGAPLLEVFIPLPETYLEKKKTENSSSMAKTHGLHLKNSHVAKQEWLYNSARISGEGAA